MTDPTKYEIAKIEVQKIYDLKNHDVDKFIEKLKSEVESQSSEIGFYESLCSKKHRFSTVNAIILSFIYHFGGFIAIISFQTLIFIEI